MPSVQSLILGAILFLVATAGFVWLMTDSGDISDPQSGNTSAPLNVINDTGSKQQVPPAVDQPDTAVSSLAPLLMKAAEKSELTGEKGRAISLSGLEELRTGDLFALFIPQENAVYEAEVTEVRDTAMGNRVVSGYSLALAEIAAGSTAEKRRFLFTIGSDQTFGTIQTGKGRYQLEVREGLGRIVSAQTLAEQLDYSRPDYVLPPEQRVSPRPPDERAERERERPN